MALEPHLIEGPHDDVAPGAVLLAHFDGIRFTMLDGLEGGLLADDAGAEHRVLMNAHHRLDNRRLSAGVADTKSSHRVSLGKAVQENRPLPHPWQGRDAH